MATTLPTTLAAADSMQLRLEAAEQRLLTALNGLPADHPAQDAARDLLAVHEEVRELVRDAYEAGSHAAPAEFSSGHEAAAAIQIERDAHTLKAEFKDVIKALFMWKDDPAERVRQKGELRSDLSVPKA